MEERNRYDEKLEHILREASVVFAEKGYHQASIRDIAAATGVSLSGLYYYFSSKEELLFLIQNHCFETILQRLERDLEEADTPLDRLRTLVRNHLRFFVNNMAEMKVLSHEAESLSGEYQRRIKKLKRAYTGEVYRILESLAPEEGDEGKEGPEAGGNEEAAAGDVEGGGRGGMDLRVAVFGLFGMMNWVYTWYRPERDVPVDRLVEEILHLFLHGYLEGLRRGNVPQSAAGDESSIWARS